MIQAAKILEQRSHLVPGKLRITEHFFEVPLSHSNPSLGPIQLFARSARKFNKPADYTTIEDPTKTQLPWLLYLQGGPGFECASPQYSAWSTFLLDKGYQILTLDQRGTGLSTPLSPSTLARFGDAKAQAEYAKHFRADSIVKDAEAIRQALTADYPEEKKKWSIMGQSFGGFCCTNYLSFHSEGVKEAFVFGGLPPLEKGPDEVYGRLYSRVGHRNEQYYAKYPEDVDRVRRIVKYLMDETVPVQGGEGRLSAARFLQLGIMFGAHGGFDRVHALVLRANNDLVQFNHLTRPTILHIENSQSWDTNIIYAILHEACYCPGFVSNWSAHRLLSKNPAFQHETTVASDKPVYFTGEMIYPFMFSDYPELAKLKAVGEILAKEKWGNLYDVEQLKKNEVPVYAATYFDDMYVDFDLSTVTARTMKGCKTYVTNSMYHNAVSAKSEDVLKAIWELRDDVID